mmetsp:Transcript_2130/g.8300  ORF Transcript_2130/g.8300 Transcript_2130/m.8300 type:complete len:340 (+) Transcript_2130:333-1352(+)
MRAAEASRPAALPASTPNAAHNAVAADEDIESGANDRLRLKYRGRRCPRWRLRGGDASTGAKSKARSSRKELMYDDDGGAPFERCANTKDGVAVWMRAVPGSNAKEVLAEATFAKTPARAFWRAVCDVERYQEFVPFVKRSFVCKDTRSSAGSGSVWVYNVVKAPVVGPRDFVIKIESAPRGADGSMTCAWHVPDDGVGPAALSGHVRLLKNSGGWELRETANGKGVAVRYRVLTDPGTALPGFLVDLANQSSVPDVMRAFNARATSGVYEREDAAAAGSGSSRFLVGLVSGGVAKELEELLQWGDFGRITTSLSARLRKMATALDARGGDSQGSASDA